MSGCARCSGRRTDDPNEVCSTYAYKWATGTISGAITGLSKGDKATVTLMPHRSNDDYADDLEDDMEITAGNGGAARFSFKNVADGYYRAVLAANPGSWNEDETDVLSVAHDEGNDDEDYTGETDSDDLSATDLRGVIRGRIANDSNGRSGLTSDESRAGVEVAIYTAKKVGGSGTTKNNYVTDKAVTDDDGDPVMVETDGDGVFMFEGLTVGDMYFLKPVSTDLYTAVRNGNPKIGRTAEKETDVVVHALTEATKPPPANTEPAIPSWDYHTSEADFSTTREDENSFVLLYKDGEVEGKVSDPSVRAAHSRVTVELHLCKETNQELDETADPPTVTTAATGCGGGVDAYEGTIVEAPVDAKGNWSAEDLREGYYEVIPDLPAGYVSVTEEGSTTDDDPLTRHTKQFVNLRGGRADDDTRTFHIKNENARTGAALTTLVINDGDGADACTPTASPTNAAPQCGHSANGSFSVVATASPGATIRLSSNPADDAPRSPGYSQAVTNGKATTVTLPKAGTRTYYVHIAAEDGYDSNRPTDAGFSIRRNADVRVKDVTLSWGGGVIELNRRELGLEPGNPDGETGDLQGRTLVEIEVSGADGTDRAIPTGDLNVEATSSTTGFGVVTWADYDVTDNSATCNASSSFAETGNTIALAANASGSPKSRDAICFRIADSDGDATDADVNPDNNRVYLLIVTRGK